MKAFIYGSTAVGLCLTASQAAAITAQEAWEALQGMATSVGQTITAESETTDGGTVTVTGVAYGFEQPNQTATTRIGKMVFAEAGDNTVRVTMDETLAFRMDDNTGPENVEVNMTFAQPGAELLISDADGGGTAFQLFAPTLEARMDSFKVNGAPVPFNMFITFKDNIASYVYGADQSVTFNVAAGSGVEARFNGADPKGGGAMDMSMATENMAFSGSMSGKIIGLADPSEMRAALDDGAGFDYTGTFGASAFAMNMAEGNQTLELNGEISGGTGGAVMDKTQFALESTYSDLNFSAAGSQIPLPQITGTAAEVTTNMTMPMTLDTPGQDFDLRVVLGDVTIGEAVWSMFDPAAAFPRDPATVLIDLAGKAKVMLDIFDEADYLSADEPAELESLTLNELRVTLGGAELTGTGDFTFDNANREVFGGMPAPDGAINLALTGGNKLLDVLTNMGLIAQEQAMMTRMMTGMIAKPGDGPDTLVSEIAVKPDGTILANGAPLPF